MHEDGLRFTGEIFKGGKRLAPGRAAFLGQTPHVPAICRGLELASRPQAVSAGCLQYPDLALRLAGLWPLVDRRQAHPGHQPADAMAHTLALNSAENRLHVFMAVHPHR